MEQVTPVFVLSDEIQKLEANPRRDMNILALYFSERKPDFRDKAQYQIGIKRHIRAAKDLTPFHDDQILAAITKAKEFVPGWTLETLIKILTK